MFYHIEVKEVPIPRNKRLGDKSFQREWDDEEYELLLKIDESVLSINVDKAECLYIPVKFSNVSLL